MLFALFRIGRIMPAAQCLCGKNWKQSPSLLSSGANWSSSKTQSTLIHLPTLCVTFRSFYIRAGAVYIPLSVTCSCWSSSLDNAVKRHTDKSTKHWFSIYQLVERYLEEQKMDANTGTYTTVTVYNCHD